MTDEDAARAVIEKSFLDHRYQYMREALEELFEDVTDNVCELSDNDLMYWFFCNYIYVVEDQRWQYHKELLQ